MPLAVRSGPGCAAACPQALDASESPGAARRTVRAFSGKFEPPNQADSD